MIEWLNLSAAIAAIIVGSFIAYHVYFLSKRLKFSDEMRRRHELRIHISKQLSEIRSGVSAKIELVNAKKYKTHYPFNNDSKGGRSYTTGELKSLRFNGVELFCDFPQEAYFTDESTLTLKKTDAKAPYNVFPVGLIPYDWIEFVDLEGDEFTYRPQLFVRFKGLKQSPYERVMYYKTRDSSKESDSIEMQYEQIEVDDE